MKSEVSSLPISPDTLDPSRVRSVLLVRLRSIGDTVLMTPCLATLKSWHPNVKITVVSEPLAAPLLDDHPLVDKLIITSGSLASRAGSVAQLRSGGFDAAFNMHGGSTGAMLVRLSGASRSVGYRDLPLSWLLSDRAPAPDVILGRSRIHSVEQQLALLSWSGVPWPSSRPQLSLAVSAEAKLRVTERLRALGIPERFGNFACIVPGAALESKRWNAEGFAAVVDHLRERWNLSSLVIAGPGQQQLAREVTSATRVRAAVLDQLSLKELVALLGIARVFVGNDGGPMHIAAAVATPIVAVWGSSDPTVWHPWTEAPYRIVDSGSRNRDGAIKDIPASEVIEAVDEVVELALGANYKADAAQTAIAEV
ncbi:MAG TPA: glycosyltransferase family 9 protein [Blastocatellia bacterium]|nr:glycosyltransferase family 9 protein [Blastocatellia bacterium]